MSYELIAYDKGRGAFFSHSGREPVSIVPLSNSSYYIAKDRSLVLRLKQGWIDVGDDLGEVLDLNGRMVRSIPHPGSIHGKFSINGVVAGDSSGFKFIVEPYEGSSDYFLWFNFLDSKFKGAGNTVR